MRQELLQRVADIKYFLREDDHWLEKWSNIIFVLAGFRPTFTPPIDEKEQREKEK